jgi:hypothetical protein
MTWTKEWKRVIFSDEKKFNLDGPDCYSYYWHNLNLKEVKRAKRKFGGGTVVVLASNVYANGRQFASVEELKARIKTCWEEIEVAMIEKLVDSMPKIIFEVIKIHVGHTKY